MSTRWIAAVAVIAMAWAAFDARAQGKDLSNQDLSKADFSGKDLAGANLSGATLFLVNFKRANLKGANLRDADLTSASLDGADLTGADLTGATVDRASFQEAVLVNAILEGIAFKGASLFRAKARGAILRGIKELADVRDADLRGADLRGADLSAAAPYGLGATKLAGAQYDAATRWPPAFDPAEAGLVKVDAPAPKDRPVGTGSGNPGAGSGAAGAGSGGAGAETGPGTGSASGPLRMGAGSGSANAPAADELATPGREVMAKFGANWLRAKVEKVEGDRVLVSWDGYDASQNSWVPRDHIQARANPHAPSGQKPGAADFYQPGKEVEVKYGANWLRGKIEKVDGDRVLVSWDGYDASQNSWVPKENVRERGAKDAPANPGTLVAPGKGGMEGVHLWAMVTPQAGTRIMRYLFKPDGTFVTGRAFADGEGVDVAKAGAKFPAEAGTYKVEGPTLTLNYADGRTATKELVPSDRGPRIKGWQRGIAFPDGHRLDAKYDVQGGVAIAGATGDQAQVWSFKADGTFAVVEGRVANAGPGGTHAHTAEELKWKGTYTLRGHTLSMTFDGGGAKDYTIFLSGEELSAAPRMLFVDMGVFKKQE